MPIKASNTVGLVLHPSAQHAMEVVDRVVYAVTGKRAVFVGLQEEGHSASSLHYGIPGDLRMRAFDVRTKGWTPAERYRILDEVGRRLGSAEFDTVLESLGKPQEHLHVEFDPDPVAP